MRSYSIFTILLLCIAILVVDIFAFFWLQSITQLIDSVFFRNAIHIAFWVFTIGLIVSIMVLKVRLDDIDPRRKQLLVSSLYGLTISSFIPKLIFVIVISILFFTNFVFSEKEPLLVIPFIGLFSGFLPFFVIAFGIFKSIYNFKTYHLKIVFKDLPETFDGLRIVHISDLHLGSFNYRFHILKRAVSKINHLKPDLIFFTGDLVNNYAWELRGWTRVFRELSSTIGKYAVLGNHDYGDYSEWSSKKEKQENFKAIKDFYKENDFNLLLNQSDIIEKNNAKIAIIGVENWGNPPFKQYGDLPKAIKKGEAIPFKILLSHDPSHWTEEVVDKTNIALTLSGHTHGMQAAFQYKQLQWSPIKYKYKHWAGLYNSENQYLHVNRGLGWLGFPGRLGMRPEISLIELKAETD
ncbi:metallophosphoesterase [Flavobacteriaceae bacterium S0825]|uniref:metallophosphoesterase n=1 Tax=Gaetbulibacter sp. S0825 TaxID=2720084 RepID=UPI00142FA5E1|nr:metallophosphoesterase [Gaetbulibacter sp. S0825]MCK0109469.1 metallophosphoesterase [Flavobacteriaceae bacterium S0825]NIX65104.1 metallophosphoesterase [Gaetbulibacter sp. S0825]